MANAEICGRCRSFKKDRFIDPEGVGRCCIKLPPHLIADEYRDDCAPLNVVHDYDTCSLFKPIEP